MPQIVGKFVQSLPVISGEKNGKEWCRVQFAIMSMDENSKMVAFDAFGEERVKVITALRPADTVIVEYSPESREFAGKYYTNLNCYRISVAKRVDPTQNEKVGEAT